MMLEQHKLENILFLDIETVSGQKTFEDLSEVMQDLWTVKAGQKYANEDKSPENLYRHAAIYAEFGKVICISCGFFQEVDGERKFRIKSFAGDDEKAILEDFAKLLNSYFSSKNHRLCAHNGKEFDYPYLSRRMLILGVKLPGILDTAGKKPWEVNHLDTLELWKFGDYKNYTSLKLLTHIFNIPTPKDDIDGSMIRDVYYEEENLERIVIYCQKDVVATARLYLRFRGEDIFGDDKIIIK